MKGLKFFLDHYQKRIETDLFLQDLLENYRKKYLAYFKRYVRTPNKGNKGKFTQNYYFQNN